MNLCRAAQEEYANLVEIFQYVDIEINGGFSDRYGSS